MFQLIKNIENFLSFQYENLYDTSLYPNTNYGFFYSIKFTFLRRSKAIENRCITVGFSLDPYIRIRKYSRRWIDMSVNSRERVCKGYLAIGRGLMGSNWQEIKS